ncbi:MAG: exonuclease [Sphingobacteriaceae bacterium]
MILSDFLTYQQQGLYCVYGDFYVDPQQPVHYAVISHAHADHAVSGNQKVYCTSPTAAFMRLRYRKNAGDVYLVDFKKSFFIKDVKITFIPAGHVLGSAQILMEYKNIKYLYTGDYKLQTDPTCEPMEWVESHVLITESTFANPGLSHPDPETEIKKLNHFDGNILLGGYALGKSQRLIWMINRYCPGKNVMVHHSILPINKIYEEFGFSPGKYELYNRKTMKVSVGNIYLVPRFTFDSYFRAVGVKRIFASGWKNLQTNENDSLFISDHVDWQDILGTIQAVNPRQIWTLHGNGEHLKKHYSGQIEVKILNA